MHRVTKELLNRSLEELQLLQPWANYALADKHKGVRVECRNGPHDMSPRGSKREVNNYIWMMIFAIKMELNHKYGK